jgi:copper chaperone
MANLNLRIENMHCGSCVRTVTQTLNGLPGTHAEQVAVGRATVTSTAPAEEIAQALAAAGFPAQVETSGP